jgi:hypothetical protein
MVTVSYSNSDVIKETHSIQVSWDVPEATLSVADNAITEEYSLLVPTSEDVGGLDAEYITMAERSAIGVFDIKAPPKSVSQKLEDATTNPDNVEKRIEYLSLWLRWSSLHFYK